ncbi:hypothetical protein DFJ43DRAFT_463781 [Lentinula guzmanii]|uniref:VASt domain-containing protein n=1 Tax=Lentinula guzmanii TaxID=2804957 RepID=A0AA38MST8_9AGAR|nr:hypothetical protein DFJ43DRAFT_463781 [Lentinula guzmanii]
MAPNFFSKLVRNPSGHTRDKSDPSSRARSPSPTPGTTSSQRSRALSSTFSKSTSATSSITASPPNSEFGKLSIQPHSRVPSIKTEIVHGHDNASDSSSLVNPNFTIVPPSPRLNALGLDVDGLPDGENEHTSIVEGLPTSASASATSLNGNSSVPLSRTISTPASSADRPSKSKLTKSRPTTPSSSTHSLPEAFADSKSPIPPVPSLPAETQAQKQAKEDTETIGGLLPSPELEVRKMSSNRSFNGNLNVSMNGTSLSHSRAGNASAPNFYHEVDDMTPIVESPTSEYPSPPDEVPTTAPVAKSQSQPNTKTTSGQLSSPRRDSDAASIRSTNASPPNSSSSKKKEASKPWRRQPTSKPTGLASAIAASGLAMANPAFSAQQQLQFSPPALHAVTRTGTSASNRKSSLGDGTPYMLPGSTSAGASSSTQFSPPRSTRSSKSRRSSIGSGSLGGKRHRHRPSLSMHSDNGANANAEFIPDPANLDYYSGLESDDSNDSSVDSSDEDDLASAIDVHDMPVTGFAVASSRRNADFHEMFRNIPEGDYLIEDYGCALQREILIQGRLYISENHICFHANILGWITDLSIPIDEIVSLEKKMTAFVIPNAILITTRQSKYTFASFLSRDTTYDVIYNIWRLVRPEALSGTLSDNASIGSGSREGGVNGGIVEGTIIGDADGSAITNAGPRGGVIQNKVTFCKCGKDGKHFSEMALDTVIPGTPDKIHNLVFTSGFIKDFLVTNQKLIDLQMSDWTPGDENHLSRTMSYIKPLSGSVGPKQTKCEIRDEVEYCDFSPSNPNAYSSTLTTTRTPDVPSGGAFSVKTRTCITYASAISSKVVVTTQVEWTGRSFIKGLIERGAIDGQKTYHSDLEKAMRAYIQEHQTEFVPEGVKLEVVVAPPTTSASPSGTAATAEANNNATSPSVASASGKPSSRGLQWALETLEGTWGVAKRSTKGALELLGDLLPPKSDLSSTSVLYIIIFALVMSNIWTWMRVPKASTVSHHPVASKPLEEMIKAEKEMSVENQERERILKEEREDRKKWIHGVVSALWDELAAGKVPSQQSQQQQMRTPTKLIPPRSFDEALGDVFALYKTLDQVEEKVKVIREGLATLQAQLATTVSKEEDKRKENLDTLD